MGTALVPYQGSTAYNIPTTGTAVYPAHGRMLMYNTSKQGNKPGFFKRVYNRAKTAFTRKLTMNNLKAKYYAGKVRSGAGRKVLEILHIHTLPSTENVILHPNKYTANVVALAKSAFKRGNAVFTNKNFEIQAFTANAKQRVARLQRSRSKKLRNKYSVLRLS